jgi:hypothetical protein
VIAGRLVHIVAVQVVASSCRRRSVSSYARRYRGSRHVPGPGVVGDVLPGPARSTPSAARRKHAAEGVTLPDLAAPGVALAAWSAMPPLRPVTGPPLPSSRVQAFSPVAPGLSCRVLVLEDSDRTRPAKPSAPRLRARLNAGLGKVGAGPRRLCVAPMGRGSASASGWAAVGGRPR